MFVCLNAFLFLGLQYVLRGDECEDWAQHPKRHAEVCRVSWLSALNGVGEGWVVTAPAQGKDGS